MACGKAGNPIAEAWGKRNVKKRVAIVTYHRAMNFGAKLQAYALQEVLREQFDTRILDYRCSAIESVFYPRLSWSQKLRSAVKALMMPEISRAFRERKHRFHEFDKRLLLSTTYDANTVKAAAEEFDCFVAGSDQVWNLSISGNDANYFLAFAQDRQKYSYAASFGGSIDTNTTGGDVPALLEGFQSLLIREQTGVDYVNRLNLSATGYRTVDPVFLIEKDRWIKSMSLSQNGSTEPYILVYFVAMRQQTNALQFAKKLAAKHGCKVILINAGNPTDPQIVYRNDVGPVEFLELILNARTVVTTSFHAEAFSIIFNKPFYYELTHFHNNTNDRLIGLAELFGLSDRQITGVEAEESPIDWDAVNQKILEYRSQSRALLFETLGSERK